MLPCMQRDELSAWLRLMLTPGVGAGTARRLLAAFGLPQQIFQQPEGDLAALATSAQAKALCTVPPGLAALEDATWQWLNTAEPAGDGDAPARRIVSLGDAAYPAALLATEDPPLLLHLLGAPRWLDGAGPSRWPLERCLAIVGSRNPTAQGAENARQFGRALRSAGLCIVSGLALGIDAAAHEGALEAGPVLADGGASGPCTIAVVGTGLDRVYPARHRDLAHRIARQGVVVSEYPLGTPPLAANFPRRNRIIAGLSQGTLVVEAALASGSLVTARLASEQGREVFAIPGSIHAPQSRGCHALIRQGAKLVESAQDVLEELRLPAAPSTASPSARPEGADGSEPPDRAASGPHADVLESLGFDPMGLDALVARTGLDASRLQVALLELELEGQVARLPGGLFQRMALA
ncbi:DNA protecting protein DprA [Paracidovorax citrulli]|uniref:DNA protecting protein DprA n=2 Tax=Paracidovorax citrulli TaxID=80869 RepID=A1TW83_PARC0|nr:DNA protecting protein DprA [Paracidovorax citrulli AAC00-1]PVY64677.1 DNA protecting protein DprA [Paracidovorax citrulli]REG71124.1 DNA protecting protein DprA [Paracidovorax citrulli]RLJ95677.1 DNA protecting protein DprA [Paracidovorax citrulli]SDJ76096.1 DNA protecting protein DprA [Paracidovorax citrulli]